MLFIKISQVLVLHDIDMHGTRGVSFEFRSENLDTRELRVPAFLDPDPTLF